MPDFDPKNIPVLEDIIEEDAGEPGTAPENAVEEPSAEINLDLFTAEPATPVDASPIGRSADLPAEQHEANPEKDITAADAAATSLSTGTINIAGISNESTDESLSSFSAIDDTLAENGLEDHDIIIDLAETQDGTDTERNHEADVIFAADTASDEEDEDEFIESALIDYQHPALQTDSQTITGSDAYHDVRDTVIEPPAANDKLHAEAETGYAVGDQQTQTHPVSGQEPEQKPGQYGQTIDLQPMVDDIIKQLIPDLEQKLRFLVRQALEDNLPDNISYDEEQQEDRQK